MGGLYLDSADVSAITRMLGTGLFRGVTTNPSVLAKSGLGNADIPRLLEASRAAGATEFFAQATGRTVDELRESASAIASLGDDVVVKFVCTEPGLTVAAEFASRSTATLITAVYHPSQMLLAGAAAAMYIAPYLGRADDEGRDSLALVRDCAAMATIGGPRILAASVRSVDHAAAAMVAGAHDVTVGEAVALALLSDELTVGAAEEFERVSAVTVTTS